LYRLSSGNAHQLSEITIIKSRTITTTFENDIHSDDIFQA